jgi:hypothetical protein
MVPTLSAGSPPPAVARAGVALRAAAFWTAVCLPFVVVALLAAGAGLSLVAPLLAGNALALVVGHDHRGVHGVGRPDRDH